MKFEPVIGLEIHAELETRSKMFCACPVVDNTQVEPNIAVCPVCAGMPGVLPVVNQRAVEYALRVALALECEVQPVSIFARKNYFYPDLPKGYQITQYEQPLARNGRLLITTSQGERLIRIRRVHLEEDTGKLIHVAHEDGGYSLVDLNRAGVPLLEIVTEPDMHSAEEVRAYAMALRSLLRYLGVNSGDMQKGVLRIEPNISVHSVGSSVLGTRTEIKNLNSFRSLERSTDYEIQRQSQVLVQGGKVIQETRGWNENQDSTFSQRVKEDEDDYRYFPEPDLPPLVISAGWLEQVVNGLPELPTARKQRFQTQYGLSAYDAGVLTTERAVADYFEETLRSAPGTAPKLAVNWITGDLFNLLNQAGIGIQDTTVNPGRLAELITLLSTGTVNQNTARSVLAEMFVTGDSAAQIVEKGGLGRISDPTTIARLVRQVLEQNPEQAANYLAGKEQVINWLFGQVMRSAQGRADPQLLRQELARQLASLSRQ